MPIKRNPAKLILLVCLVLYVAFAVVNLHIANEKYLWDFRMYIDTIRAYDAGINPYDAQAVSRFAGRDVSELYYFPLTLWVLKPFAAMPYAAASVLFLSIKCGLLIFLIVLWQRVFLHRPDDVLFVLFCILAYNATIYLDMRAGNVSLFEVVFTWAAFWAYLKNRMVAFSLLLGMAALFRLTPLFFSLLLVFCTRELRLRGTVALGAAIVSAAGAAWIADANLLVRFFPHALSITGEPLRAGIINPASFTLISSLADTIWELAGVDVPRIALRVTYVVWVAFVFVMSWRAFRRLDVNDPEHRIIIINLMCLVYALILPRFKDYSYILLLLPTYFIIVNMRYTPAFPFAFGLCVLSCLYVTLPGFRTVARLLWNFYPFFIATVIWSIYLWEIKQGHAARGP